MSIKIESDVPPPAGGRNKYPLNEMKIGDSFWVEGIEHRGGLYSAANYHGKNNNKKFVVRKEGDGIRCWRTQ